MGFVCEKCVCERWVCEKWRVCVLSIDTTPFKWRQACVGLSVSPRTASVTCPHHAPAG